tara:strand:- start:23 stop:193 length:171 start_codon:yes stop_codon:yes gene_type:complete
MARVLPEHVEENAEKSPVAWRDNWQDLQANDSAAENILAELDNMRNNTVQCLKALN